MFLAQFSTTESTENTESRGTEALDALQRHQTVEDTIDHFGHPVASAHHRCATGGGVTSPPRSPHSIRLRNSLKR